MDSGNELITLDLNKPFENPYATSFDMSIKNIGIQKSCDFDILNS